jgi:hypothetical protein
MLRGRIKIQYEINITHTYIYILKRSIYGY